MTTPKETQRGMMNRDFDETFNGMLFIMKNQDNCFWMKDCIIPLDIIFINGDEIVNVYHNCPPCNSEECESYCGDASMILEVAGGTCKKYDIKKGDTVVFP